MFDGLKVCKIKFEGQKSLPLGINKGSGTPSFLRFIVWLGFALKSYRFL